MIECSRLAKIAKQKKRSAWISATIAHLQQAAGYELGYVLGVLLGDGMIVREKKGGIVTRLEVISETFAEKFYSLLSKIVPAETNVMIGQYTQTKKSSCAKNPEYTSFTRERVLTTWIVRCHNPGVGMFFEGLISSFYTKLLAPSEVKGLLDGLFDSEACFKKERYGLGYRFSVHMTDHNVIGFIKRTLSGLEVPSCHFVSKTGYSACLSVGRKTDLTRLCSIIRFSVADKEQIRNEILRRTT